MQSPRRRALRRSGLRAWFTILKKSTHAALKNLCEVICNAADRSTFGLFAAERHPKIIVGVKKRSASPPNIAVESDTRLVAFFAHFGNNQVQNRVNFPFFAPFKAHSVNKLHKVIIALVLRIAVKSVEKIARKRIICESLIAQFVGHL